MHVAWHACATDVTLRHAAIGVKHGLAPSKQVGALRASYPANTYYNPTLAGYTHTDLESEDRVCCSGTGCCVVLCTL